MGTYILEVCGLDLRVDVEPLQHLVTCHTCVVRTLEPRNPARQRELSGVPLNCICSRGLPPKTAILVLCRSFMSVTNIAHVDAQFAFPTIAMFLRARRQSASPDIPR